MRRAAAAGSPRGLGPEGCRQKRKARTASAMAAGDLKGTSTPLPSAITSFACANGVATGTAPAAIASASVPLLVCPSEVCAQTNTSADWNRYSSSADERYLSSTTQYSYCCAAGRRCGCARAGAQDPKKASAPVREAHGVADAQAGAELRQLPHVVPSVQRVRLARHDEERVGDVLEDRGEGLRVGGRKRGWRLRQHVGNVRWWESAEAELRCVNERKLAHLDDVLDPLGGAEQPAGEEDELPGQVQRRRCGLPVAVGEPRDAVGDEAAVAGGVGKAYGGQRRKTHSDPTWMALRLRRTRVRLVQAPLRCAPYLSAQLPTVAQPPADIVMPATDHCSACVRPLSLFTSSPSSVVCSVATIGMSTVRMNCGHQTAQRESPSEMHNEAISHPTARASVALLNAAATHLQHVLPVLPPENAKLVLQEHRLVPLRAARPASDSEPS